MGRINWVSLLLALGAMGQFAFYDALFPRGPAPVMWIALLLPWLTVFTISFCRVPPFGPRRFRHALIFAMVWYAGFTLLAEALHLFTPSQSWGGFPITLARVFMYLGALSFPVFARFCAALRRYEKEIKLERDGLESF
jgi:hypothetical protein